MRLDSSSELFPALMAGFANGPLTVASAISVFHQSTPEHIDPLRTVDVAGMPDFFDHAGNFVNGHVAALLIIHGSIAVGGSLRNVSDRQKIVATSIVAAAVSTGVNVAYEAGVPMGILQKPPEAPFDSQDALYGSFAGLLTAGVFCITALRAARIRAHRRQSRRKR